MYFSSSQGKLDEAKPYMEEVLAIDKKVYGDEHPEIATDLNNLAQLLNAQGKPREALEIMKQVLETQKKVFGADQSHHPNVKDAEYAVAFLTEQVQKL